MKKFFSITLFAIALLSSSFISPNNEELKWMDFNEGYELAKKKNKIMLVDVYTDWCGWCKVMDRETYAKPEVIKMINADFVAIKFNPEKKDVVYTFEGKQYTGDQLAGVISNNQLTGYPTTIFMYPKGKKMNVVGGYQNENNFKSLLTGIKSEFKTGVKK
ncbi:MAG: thioredoxin family protein [Bacteroidota bacterium]